MKLTPKIFIRIILVALAIVATFFYVRSRPAAPASPGPTPPPPSTLPVDQMLRNEYVPAAAKDNIKDISVTAGSTISSPFTITGSARTWYFEGSFGLTLLDANGKTLVDSYVTAQSDWMTADFVPFKGTITFSKPTTATGTLILTNDNPSGDPAREQSVRIPVRFSGVSVDTVAGGCHPTGCSGQICSDEDAITTCEFLPEYGCYKTATCARQANGECGWTPTPELTACIEKAKK